MESKMTIEYPANLPDILQATRLQFEQEARMAMAVKLFEMKRISSGIAAALAGWIVFHFYSSCTDMEPQ